MKPFRLTVCSIFSALALCSGAYPMLQVLPGNTIIKEDSMNLAIFMVDFNTYVAESVNISCYARCTNGCDTGALPFSMYFDNYWDYAHVYFHYTFDNSLLFQAGIYWMGIGNIDYPVAFIPLQSFASVSEKVPLPPDAQYYETTIVSNGFCTWAEYRERAQRAWRAVDSLEITHIFAEKPFRVGLYGYSRTEGLFDPANADWMIFLYRGNADPVSVSTPPNPGSCRIYPNPSRGIFTIDLQEEISRLEIFTVHGKKLVETTGVSTKEIDASWLPDGMYILRVHTLTDILSSTICIKH